MSAIYVVMQIIGFLLICEPKNIEDDLANKKEENRDQNDEKTNSLGVKYV